MDWLREILSRCAALLGRKRLDHDLDDELGAHLELAIAENIRRGMSESEARTAALRAFGGQTQIKENYRVQRGIPFLEILAQDLRYAARRLRSSPGFTAGCGDYAGARDWRKHRDLHPGAGHSAAFAAGCRSVAALSDRRPDHVLLLRRIRE